MKHLSLILVAMILAACVAAPQLASRPGGNPNGVDLSGQWVLRGAADLPLTDEQSIVIPRRSSRVQQTTVEQGRRASRPKGSSAHVFLESGKSLKITQTTYGLFISFDRAVVEEYTFGENRKVSVGPIEAQRVSGWTGSTLLIETLDDKGYLLSESWSLDEQGEVLSREIRIARGDDEKLSTLQVFDRE